MSDWLSDWFLRLVSLFHFIGGGISWLWRKKKKSRPLRLNRKQKMHMDDDGHYIRRADFYFLLFVFGCNLFWCHIRLASGERPKRIRRTCCLVYIWRQSAEFYLRTYSLMMCYITELTQLWTPTATRGRHFNLTADEWWLFIQPNFKWSFCETKWEGKKANIFLLEKWA